MEFQNINSTIECDCLKDSHLDTENEFARRIGKTKEPKSRDFKTHFEKGKLLNEHLNDCDKVCGSHGVSVDIWNNNSKDEILEKYLLTFRISPKHRNNISIFRFKNSSGQVKHTPVEKDPMNYHHHDFYKSDSFSVEEDLVLVDLIEIKE